MVALPTVMSQRLLLHIRQNYQPATIDTARSGIDQWFEHELAYSANPAQERQAEDDHAYDVRVENMAMKRPYPDSTELDWYTEGRGSSSVVQV